MRYNNSAEYRVKGGDAMNSDSLSQLKEIVMKIISLVMNIISDLFLNGNGKDLLSKLG